jgi:hypothetical protein
MTIMPLDGVGSAIISVPDAGPVDGDINGQRAADIDVTIDTGEGWWAEVSWPARPVNLPAASAVEPAASR